MQFEGALHIYDGTAPNAEVERAVACANPHEWGRAVGIGSPDLPAHRLTRLSTLRGRYRRLVDEIPEGVPVIYHQLTGLDLFASEDLGHRRFLWIHEPFVRWSTVIGWAARYADAFIFDHPEWYAEMLATVNWIPRRRRTLLSLEAMDARASVASSLGTLLDLPIKRQNRSPSGSLNVLGFYRRQIQWLV